MARCDCGRVIYTPRKEKCHRVRKSRAADCLHESAIDRPDKWLQLQRKVTYAGWQETATKTTLIYIKRRHRGGLRDKCIGIAFLLFKFLLWNQAQHSIAPTVHKQSTKVFPIDNNNTIYLVNERPVKYWPMLWRVSLIKMVSDRLEECPSPKMPAPCSISITNSLSATDKRLA